MSKELSDIGSMSAGYTATRTEDGKDVSWSSKRRFYYNDEERREFAELLIAKWEEHAISMGLGRDHGVPPNWLVDNFLCEHGI